MNLIFRALQEVGRAFESRKRSYTVSTEIGALSARLPLVGQFATLVGNSMSVLQTHYHAYVGRVSSPLWALSLETASVLYALCNVLRPAAILDLGSGFSSVTFRLYAQSAGHECIIHSVDDQLQWLERSGQFLQSINLSTEGLMLLPELNSQGLGGYDLILHDLGNMQLRAETLGIVLAQRSATGWVMLDDMHKEPYGSAARAACASAHLTLFSLQELTRDQYGRFACLASAPTSVSS